MYYNLHNIVIHPLCNYIKTTSIIKVTFTANAYWSRSFSVVEFQIQFLSLLDQQGSFLPELINFPCVHIFLIFLVPLTSCVVKCENTPLSHSHLPEKAEEAESRHK